MGANGCGKSTLLKTICRIIRPMDGDVLLDGKSIGSYGSRELAKGCYFASKSNGTW
ncbi:MAG: ATP-binding cassette domain-containing protein [Veillonella sp.]